MATKSETTTPLIYSKVAAVMAEIDFIGKGRKNSAQNYQFRGIDDIYNTLHGPLTKHCVFVTNEVLKRETAKVATRSGGEMQHVVLHIRYTLWASDGSYVSTETTGEAMDSGDKAEGKAQSYALKVALMQLFCIPTEEQKDTEYDTPERVAARPPIAAPPLEASAPAMVPAAPSATPVPSGEPAPEMIALASEAQKKELVAMLANPLLDAEERTLLLTPPVDERSAKWVADTLVKLANLFEVRKDPKKALAAAQNQLRTAATKYATQMGEDQHKAWLLRASAITAKPEELRAEARQILAYYQSVAA